MTPQVPHVNRRKAQIGGTRDVLPGLRSRLLQSCLICGSLVSWKASPAYASPSAAPTSATSFASGRTTYSFKQLLFTNSCVGNS